MIVIGDSLRVMAAMKPDSVDAIVTDPPAGIGFMNKSWDHDRGGRTAWVAWMTEIAVEALRVAKPGAHALVWALPRTSHWTAWAWEDAGWIVRDRVNHLFGQGFPKSLQLGGGCGTALKPAAEDWWLLRKPFAGTVRANFAEWGTGGLNIDACRIGGIPRTTHADGNRVTSLPDDAMLRKREHGPEPAPRGRWPANVILTHSPDCELVGAKRVRSHSTAVPDPAPDGEDGAPSRASKWARQSRDQWRMEAGAGGYADAEGLETVEAWDCEPDCPVRLLDEQSGERKAGGNLTGLEPSKPMGQTTYGDMARTNGWESYGDTGGASRFFYTAKASRSEREAWGRMPGEAVRRSDGRAKDIENPRLRTSARVNNHPTVKPLELMAWLIKLVTPPGGLILDPFAGSGSTLVAAKREGFRALGIEMDPDSARIARARLDAQWEVKLL